MTPNIGILGTGSYLPKEEITNEEIARRVPNITAEWIGRRTLIQGRRYAAPHEATSDLARHAATAALARAGVDADRIDHLIVATSTGDAPLPPTSSLVQNALGAHRAVCFDINIACAGFVYALDVARALVAQRPGSLALVIGADLYSRFLDYDDRGTAVLLGDAAGAAVVGAVPEPYGILDTELAGRGDVHELIWIEGGGSRVPASADTVANGGHFLRMTGRGVADFVMRNVPPMIGPLLERTGTPWTGSRTSCRTRPTGCSSANWSSAAVSPAPTPTPRSSSTGTWAPLRCPWPWTRPPARACWPTANWCCSPVSARAWRPGCACCAGRPETRRSSTRVHHRVSPPGSSYRRNAPCPKPPLPPTSSFLC